MDLNPGQLDALVAIADHGSFEAAARQLHVTPSAVSQRIRALEAAAGQVLISRGTPCRPTPQGEWLVRLGTADPVPVRRGGPGARPRPPRSSCRWRSTPTRSPPGSATCSPRRAAWEGTAIRLRVEDQGYSQDLLRRGDVLAAVTSDPAAVQGCAVDPLGALRYLPAAAPALADRWRRGGSPDWAAMPVVIFNAKDDLQHELLRRYGVEQGPPVVHQVPSSADFYAAVSPRAWLGHASRAAGPPPTWPRASSSGCRLT